MMRERLGEVLRGVGIAVAILTALGLVLYLAVRFYGFYTDHWSAIWLIGLLLVWADFRIQRLQQELKELRQRLEATVQALQRLADR